jgi:hypothetical protein
MRAVPTFSLAQKHAELHAQQARLLAKLAREAAPDVPMRSGATAGGDPSRLRGLPAIGRGSSGAVRGTDPERALLAKERRERQR